MNFVVYFERLDETRVLPEHRHYQTLALQKLRSRNMPLRDQKKHMEQLCSHLNGTETEAEEAWNSFLQQTGQQKVSRLAEWMDFFPFVFLYSGLFQESGAAFWNPGWTVHKCQTSSLDGAACCRRSGSI